MNYNFTEIEKKWQKFWKENEIYKVTEDPHKPKYYVLDMFPYPSGAGLHVGHPLGYIASDIFARYKRMNGFNVLHPMGYDSFGLPAEQYAIQTGRHPAETTAENIRTYRRQLDQIGFSFDWSREVRTSEPEYYQWTQWIFLKLFKSWFDNSAQKARPVDKLVRIFEKEGNGNIDAASEKVRSFTAEEWRNMTEPQQQNILLNYRLAYTAHADVNWCPALGTVLANDEVKDGYSERGGYPVYKKSMKQWFLRITAYADRLLKELDKVDWTESIKEVQRNWIGRSDGALLKFHVKGKGEIDVFTTRPDTVFGATFMVLAPEHPLVEKITADNQRGAVHSYKEYVKLRSERDRVSEVKKVTGEFTGAYAIHPFTGEEIPVWIAEYVLAGYGTGAIMAVPAHDARDHAFARHFGVPVQQVVKGKEEVDINEGSLDAKEGTLIHSDFLNGMDVPEAIEAAIQKAEEKGVGERQVNYKLRDAAFSRQRYWGEPFPVYYKNDLAYTVNENKLPVELPEISSYKPTEKGDPPLARAENWETKDGFPLETDTMPGYAGSSWYFFRYMDPHNKKEFVSKEKQSYWKNVDLYLGGAEHATGHLLYARFWTHFLYDLGYVDVKEPFQKMINQGMIQGVSYFAYKKKGSNEFVSFAFKNDFKTIPVRVDINLVGKDNELNIEGFKKWREEFADAKFPKVYFEDGKYICGSEVEKMSKSKFNVINPDDVISEYGADAFRMYEMFLGPIEQHKPWDTQGIDGIARFLRKFWRLFFNDEGKLQVIEEKPDGNELKILHKTIKKVKEDIERFSFNTAISAMMVCVNELAAKKCNKKIILSDLILLIAPFAPHIAEELWKETGHKPSVIREKFPEYKESYIKEDTFEYPVAINGKMRAKINLSLDLSQDQVKEKVLKMKELEKWLENPPKKVIYVKGKIINLVV